MQNTTFGTKTLENARQANLTYGAALKFFREEKHLRLAELSQRVGVSQKQLEDFEANRAYPTGLIRVKLEGSLPKLRPYAGLIPRKANTPDAPPPEAPKRIVIEAPAAKLPTLSENNKREVPQESVPPPSGPPKPFPRALAEERVRSGLSQRELGELLTNGRSIVGQSVISSWETGKAVPVEVHYRMLLDLFENLKNAEEPKWRNIKPPVGGRGLLRSKANDISNDVRMAGWREKIDNIAGGMGSIDINLAEIVSPNTSRTEASLKVDTLIGALNKIKSTIDGSKEVVEPPRPPPAPKKEIVTSATRLGNAIFKKTQAELRYKQLKFELDQAEREYNQAVFEEQQAKKIVEEEAKRQM